MTSGTIVVVMIRGESFLGPDCTRVMHGQSARPLDGDLIPEVAMALRKLIHGWMEINSPPIMMGKTNSDTYTM